MRNPETKNKFYTFDTSVSGYFHSEPIAYLIQLQYIVQYVVNAMVNVFIGSLTPICEGGIVSS